MTAATVAGEGPDGVTLVDDNGDTMDAGCPEHSQHWLAVACRGNRRAVGMEPQECEERPECATVLAEEQAHHDRVRSDCEEAAVLVARRREERAREATR